MPKRGASASAKRRPTRRLTKTASTSRKSPAGRPVADGTRLLALDVSSVCVGWAVFDGATLTAHGRYIQVGPGHGERLANYATWLTAMLAEWAPHHLAYEAPYAGRRRFTYGVLMMYAAVALLVHVNHFGVEMPDENRVAAHLVKKRLRVRKGKSHEENKRIVLLEINRLYGLSLKYKANDKTKKVTQDDEADAIAVGHVWWMGQEGADV